MTNRRYFLKNLGIASLAVPLLACDNQSKVVENSPSDSKNTHQNSQDANPKSQGTTACDKDLRYDFYGKHQAGIVTPVQRHCYFLVADLHSTDKQAIGQMFKDWTDFAVRLTQGNNVLPYDKNPHLPPSDTGEADSLGVYGLTLTFGVSPSFFDKLGLDDKKPADFNVLPKFPKDQIRDALSGGDICIQACSQDPQVAFHAVRQLVRKARALITMKWSQSGFVSFDNATDTPRNLFGFKDGTANHKTAQDFDKWLWIDDGIFKNGSYLVVRLIQMHLETWDRTAMFGQEDTFARHRYSGAFVGKTDEFDDVDIHAKHDLEENSHTVLAKKTGVELLRRSYSYASGVVRGQFDAGLLFISFQKHPNQFSVIQNQLGTKDKMTEYTTHIGSGVFLCFGGVAQGEYLGQKLFE